MIFKFLEFLQSIKKLILWIAHYSTAIYQSIFTCVSQHVDGWWGGGGGGESCSLCQRQDSTDQCKTEWREWTVHCWRQLTLLMMEEREEWHTGVMQSWWHWKLEMWMIDGHLLSHLLFAWIELGTFMSSESDLGSDLTLKSSTETRHY